jgi:hypothetical protein
MNFVIPYNSVYKDLNSNKLRSIKTEPPSAFEQKIPNLVKEPNDNNGNKLQNKCEVIHIGFVCSGFKSNLYLHTLLKSLFFYRISPVHFHIIVNKVSERVLKTLFETWNLPQSNTTFYDINDLVQDVRWVPNSHYSGIFGLLKLVFPKIVPLNVTKKIVVLDTDLTFLSDIQELWKIFDKFNSKQAVGIVENQSDYYVKKNGKIKPWPASGRGFVEKKTVLGLENFIEVFQIQFWSVALPLGEAEKTGLAWTVVQRRQKSRSDLRIDAAGRSRHHKRGVAATHRTPIPSALLLEYSTERPRFKLQLLQ